ncbi:hypothetical protein [Domibacillus mangrovi]|uniref:Uncharacterized protein n=1 Tax=Domibacillus mangrovi TaxID=1714354 RepID=A0A1Q5P3W1_9BACI|nr:hypothetical protein [Domibacillus mangrovi]OKL36812.1 hypothetical protein BLL40_08790 [Domibacillus mangrovi]
MKLEDAFNEYIYYFLPKGFINKTLLNKWKELKNVKVFLKDKSGITQWERIYPALTGSKTLASRLRKEKKDERGINCP